MKEPIPLSLIDRREALGLGAAGAVAQALPGLVGGADLAEPDEFVPLWPGPPPGAPAQLPPERVIERAPPGSQRDRIAVHVARPLLAVFRARRPTGGAVLIIPGGGFVRVALDKEGYETARWLRDRGVTAFVLRYRFPGDGWRDRAATPLQDAQRSMRLIRDRAARYAIDPNRVGAIGFSAGGHVAAMLSVASDRPTYAPVDSADRLGARPLTTGLVYPLISMTDLRPGEPNELLGPAPSDEAIRAFSAERHVSTATPPSIIFQAGDDTTVPLENGFKMYAALRKAQVAGELHLFEAGGHGFGLRLDPALTTARWPDLFLAFASAHRL